MSDRNRAPKPLTPDELEALEQAAVPCVGLALTPSGDVLVQGRHALGINDQVVRLSPEDALSIAHTIAMGLLGSVRAFAAAAARGQS